MQQRLFPGEAEHHIPSCMVSVNISSLSISRWVIRVNKARPFVTVHKCAIKVHHSQHILLLEKQAANTGSCGIPQPRALLPSGKNQGGKAGKARGNDKTKVPQKPGAVG